MTQDEIKNIFENTEPIYGGRPFVDGMAIFSKYVQDGDGEYAAAEHDEFYYGFNKGFIERISEPDLIALRKLGWRLSSDADGFEIFT